MSNNKLNINKLMWKRAKEIYAGEPSGHDIGHISRVVKYCRQLHRVEGGNWDVIYPSALFHDIHRVMQSKVGHFVTAHESMPEVVKVLNEFKSYITPENMQAILHSIDHHDDKYMSRDDMSIELAILQDADSLDALGNRGLHRSLKYCKHHGIPIYYPLPLDTHEYIPDVHPISTTHYVYRTMLPKYDNFKTKQASIIGNRGRQILKCFVNNNIKQKK